MATVSVLLLAAAACGGSNATDTPSRANDAGPPPGCDPAADAKNTPGCAVETYALFVSAASGKDDAPGTRAQPLRSIRAAVEKLAGRSRIYLCGADIYTENIQITNQQPFSIYGGYSCDGFFYDGRPAVITSTGDAATVAVAATTSEIVLSDLDIRAQAGSGPGASALGVLASEAWRVVLRRAHVSASAGTAGRAGVPVAAYTPDHAPQPQGGLPVANPLCPANIGGTGGSSANGIAQPGSPSANGAAGGSAKNTTGVQCIIGDAHPGPAGTAGTGGSSPAEPGQLRPDGWRASVALSGTEGGMGSGGGGGGSTKDTGSVGGAGGSGGCAGAGGERGTAGGSSIGIASYRSALVLETTEVAVAAAGAGGAGAPGQQGQAGAAPGTSQNDACAGGFGGDGGGGGGGGGGAGGMSVGILFSGSLPVIDGLGTASARVFDGISIGVAGAGGAGGSASAATYNGHGGAPGGDGAAGVASAIFEVP